MWSDNETKIDLLGFQYLANAVSSIIRKDHLLPATIGVFGDWGSGKSSLIQVIQEDLEKEEGVVVVSFNGWLFEGYEDAKTALMGSILEELMDHRKFLAEAKSKAKKLLRRVDGLKVAGGVGKLAIGIMTGGLPIAFSGGADLVSAIRGGAEQLKEVDAEALKGYFKEGKEEDEASLRRSIRDFRKDFAELLAESKIKKLVVVIDDLDRCLPDTIIETLEAIKLFLFVPSTAFILGADERLVKYAVRKRFPELPGERVEVGRDYLEKLVQFPVRVPPLGRAEMETYMGLLFLDLAEVTDDDRLKAREAVASGGTGALTSVNFNLEVAQNLFQDRVSPQLAEQLSLAQRIAPLLGTGLKGNPRQCKRFLNTLLMRLDMATHRDVELDERTLAKLMLLEYFKPESFRRLAELQGEQEGKPRELALMESEAGGGPQIAPEAEIPEQEMEDQADLPAREPAQDRAELALPASSVEATTEPLESEFKAWLDQNWTRQWLRMEPPLTGVDLRPYFFFSRDILYSPFGGDTQRMSPLAQELLADLLHQSKAVQNRALAKAQELSMADSVAIFESLTQRAQLEEEYGLENRPFQALLDWAGTRKELLGELVGLLRRLPESAVSPVIIPRLLQLCKDQEAEDAAYELLAKWERGQNERLATMAKSRRAKRR